MTPEDLEFLACLNPKLQLIRDRVRGVVEQLATGFYLWGEGGTSKSYTVLEELQRLRSDYILHNSRMTGRGLVDMLQKFPTSIHVLEDVETLLDDKKSWGVLRSALHSQSRKKPPERQVTGTAFNTDIRFVFTGGIITIANTNISDNPELRALATRIPVLQLVASFEEVAALMRSVSEKGYAYGDDYLAPSECRLVAEWILDKMRGMSRPLDMRMLTGGFQDYIQFKTGKSKTYWQDLLDTRINGTTETYEGRSERSSREHRIALEINAMSIDRAKKLELWQERVKDAKGEPKSERAFYRSLARV